MDKNYDVINIVSKFLYFKKVRSTYFADIIKLVTIFIKRISKDSRKVQKNRNYVSKSRLYVGFLM